MPHFTVFLRLSAPPVLGMKGELFLWFAFWGVACTAQLESRAPVPMSECRSAHVLAEYCSW